MAVIITCKTCQDVGLCEGGETEAKVWLKAALAGVMACNPSLCGADGVLPSEDLEHGNPP